MNYQEKIKLIRQKLDISVAKMAKLLDMSASTLTNYERGDRTPSIDFLSQMNIKLNVNANWFVSGQGEMFNAPKFEDVEDKLEQKVVEVMKKYGIIEK